MKKIFCFLSVLTLFGCAIGDPHEAFDYEVGTLSHELLIHFPELTVPEYYKKAPQYKDIHGFVPISGGSIGWNDLCGNRVRRSCFSFTIGTEILKHPDLFEKIKKALMNPCETFTIPTEQTALYYWLEGRIREVKKLRQFMGCDGAKKEQWDIHFYVIKDIDDVMRPIVRDKEKEVRPRIVDHFIVQMN